MSEREELAQQLKGLSVHSGVVPLMEELKAVRFVQRDPSAVAGLVVPEERRYTWPQLVDQMQCLKRAGIQVTPAQDRDGYTARVPDGWVEPVGSSRASGLIALTDTDDEPGADPDVVHLYDQRMQYAQQQVEDGKDLTWPQAWDRAVVAMPDALLAPLTDNQWARFDELKASHDRRVANMTQVISNLSQALESSGKATAEWRGKYEALLRNVQRCPAGSSCYLPDLED